VAPADAEVALARLATTIPSTFAAQTVELVASQLASARRS
jgi:hypothetical protein